MAEAVLVNAGRLNFDGSLDFSALESVLGTGGRLIVYNDTASGEELLKRLSEGAKNVKVIITKEWRLGAETIERLPESVGLICEAGTGYNNIDLAACSRKAIKCCNVPSYSEDGVASLVITYLLNFSCSMVEQQVALRRGDRSNFTKSLGVPHFEVNGKTLGLIGGSGTIGRKVCDIAVALGMRVLIYSRSAGEEDHPLVESASLDDLLRRSDFVSIHCPLNSSTRHLMNASTFSKMKKGSYLINTARGGIVNEGDLLAALRDGTLKGAALDVTDPEPPAEDSPLYSMENVILTPHIGWKRVESRQRLVECVAGNISGFLGREPNRKVHYVT